jgi:hypothetical protein
MYWSAKMGRFDRSFEDPANPVERYKPNPHASGKNGGHAINLHQFARAGMTLLGRVIATDGHKITLAPDLKEKVAQPTNIPRIAWWRSTSISERRGWTRRSRTTATRTTGARPTDRTSKRY